MKVLTALASVGILGTGCTLGASTQASPTGTPTGLPEPTGKPTPSMTTASPPTTPDPSSAIPTQSKQPISGKSGTFTGPATAYKFGTITVSVTLEAGIITDVRATGDVQDEKSPQYNSRAFPLLRDEVLAANSANVETVSGATLTSEAYRTSLQAALDQAK